MTSPESIYVEASPLRTFRAVAVTTQALYGHLVQTLVTSAGIQTIPADVAEVLHDCAKALATAVHSESTAPQAFRELATAAYLGDELFTARLEEKERSSTPPGEI